MKHKIKNNNRMQRVSDVVHRCIANYINRDFILEYNIGMVTVVDVNVTRDMSYAKIFVSVLENNKEEQTLKVLNDLAGMFRYHLANNLMLRMVPKVKFIIDDSFVKGQYISTLIDKALNK